MSTTTINITLFNNVYVKDELRSTTWAIDNITNLGSTFYVSPCIIFTNPSVYINSKSGTTVTLTITDNNIISSTIGGQTWTSGSKIKLMGRINTSVLGVVNGTMARQLNTTTAKTAYITLNFATTNDCAGIEQGKTYSGSAVGDLKMMMYEVNLNVNGTTKNRPVGIRMSSYNEDKKSSIDIYNGRVAILQGTSNNKIVIKAQYNSTNFTNATFTASSSDIRLKEDVKDSSVNALSKIMQMQIREFNWKQTGVHQELGCVADELELIDPLLTTGGGYDDDGTMNIKSIDTLLLSEYAIKGIQELYKQYKKQQKRIEYLESQLNNR